jgi:uncharacterized protein involved in exopolysaccharide biosynthesis
MKRPGGLDSPQQLREVEIADAENGNAEPLVEIRMRRRADRAWLLWENRRFLWRFTLCGVVLATIVAFLLPKQFVSTARLMPPEKELSGTSPLAMVASMAKGGSGGFGGSGLGQVASDLLGTKSQGALYIEVLRGRTIADALIQRFDLRKVYGVRYWEDARKSLEKRTEIVEDRKSGVIVIKVRDRDPRCAAQITQAYVEELNRLVATVSTSAARRERIFIEQRLQTVKQDLETAEHKFSEYASKNTAIDIPEQGKAMVEAAAVLQGQLIAAQSELQGLSQIYTDSNVRVRSLRARVAELQRQLAKMGGDDASLNSDNAPSSLPANSASNEYDSSIYPSIRKLPLLGVRWADLYRQTKITETVYGLLNAQYELAKIQEAKEIPSVQAFDPADIPEKKSGPPRLLIMVLAAMFSFGIAMAWILGTTAWKELEPGDPRKEFLEHVIGDVRVSLLRKAARARQRWNSDATGESVMRK